MAYVKHDWNVGDPITELLIDHLETQYEEFTKLYDAHSILIAIGDDTPVVLPLGASSVVGRTAASDIIALTGAQLMAILTGQAGADFSMNTHKITSVTDPGANQDAATKKYVDDNIPVVPTLVRKTADETVNNSVVLQNDDDLLLALGANEVWLVQLFILCSTELSANPDIKFGFAYPVGCTIRWGPIGGGGTVLNFSWGYSAVGASAALRIETGTQSFGLAQVNEAGICLTAIVANGANAGTLNFQWAQNAAVAEDTKVLENSCLIANQLA